MYTNRASWTSRRGRWGCKLYGDDAGYPGNGLGRLVQVGVYPVGARKRDELSERDEADGYCELVGYCNFVRLGDGIVFGSDANHGRSDDFNHRTFNFFRDLLAPFNQLNSFFFLTDSRECCLTDDCGWFCVDRGSTVV